ncbi:hypothetical protein KIN20_030621 [Parelaphostrongylus tenuis]|uniref:Uncharacterized protein n=1 Tax=Parelaphostrongylus tenuis TaxID=148309 RepID=A0AAD5R4H9_PARTN|nr:hypothetical protein KIN20_030621 [Parelaphostrongylus tenuis]
MLQCIDDIGQPRHLNFVVTELDRRDKFYQKMRVESYCTMTQQSARVEPSRRHSIIRSWTKMRSLIPKID